MILMEIIRGLKLLLPRHRLLDFKGKMHQIRVRLRLRPDPAGGGELTALPDP